MARDVEQAEAARWDREARAAAHMGRAAAWRLARALYEIHERALWQHLGYSSVREWLSDPELEVGYQHALRLIEAWRETVVVRGVEPERIEAIPPSRVRAVLPAVRQGRVDIDRALADAEVTPRRDLERLYAQPSRDEPIDPAQEPRLVRCPTCGSWVEERDVPAAADR